MRARMWLTMGALLSVGVLLADAGDVWARARGGGSRGSRSYSAPAAPTSPSSPSRSFTQPSSPAAPAAPVPQRSGFGRGLLGGIAGFALGGLLGGLLFGGLGQGFAGIGMMDILLIGGGLFLLYRFMQSRRQSTAPAYAGASMGGGGAAALEAPAGAADVDRGLSHIRQMDAGFDPETFVRSAADAFRSVQSAVVMRDMAMIRNRLTPEMYSMLQGQCDELKAAGRSNHIEQMDIERSEITEMWQERGQDFVTVFLAGRLLDYTTDDRSGALVAGSKTDADKFEEFWTFTRPVGPNAWKLTAIQTA